MYLLVQANVTDTVSSTAGCDIIRTINVTSVPLQTVTVDTAVCATAFPATILGHVFTGPGNVTDTVSSTAGCDIIRTINVTSVPLQTVTIDTIVCASAFPATILGHVFTGPGNVTDTVSSATGCNTIRTINVTSAPLQTVTINTGICASGFPATVLGHVFNAPGSITDTVSSTVGCDTIRTINVTSIPLQTVTLNVSVCPNQLPYNWNGNSYSSGGTYTDTIISTTGGCDTIGTLNLVISTVTTSTTNITVCNNQLPYSWNGNSYASAGTYNVTLTNASGCDSIATLVLAISQVTTSTTNVSVCTNLLPYTWNGNNYSTIGTYSVTLTNGVGCDSIATLVLTISPPSTSSTTLTTCAESFTLPDGTVVSTSGTYTSVLTNAAGCDSIITTNITFLPTVDIRITNPAPVCSPATVDITAPGITAGSEPGLTYSYWTNAAGTNPLANPTAIGTSGTYYIKVSAPGRCDSIAPVQVIINPLPTATLAGGGLVCEGAETELTVTFTGTAPFRFTYTDGTNTFNLGPINSNTYQFAVAPLTNTTYTITSVSDANCTNPTISSSVAITVEPKIVGVRYPTVITRANVPVQLIARNLGAGYTYNWTPITGLNFANVINPIFQHDRPTEYLIHITSAAGCPTVDTVLVQILPEEGLIRSDLFVPKAWSPNGDGHNDKLYPLTVRIRELKYFRVFNRWGQLMFETKVIGQGWDGIFRGQPQVMDTYTWTVEAIGEDGKTYKRSGNSVLLR